MGLGVCGLPLDIAGRMPALPAELAAAARSSSSWENGESYRYDCSLACFARELEFATVQIDAAFHDNETEAGAVARADIAATLESIEQPCLIGIGNADATVTTGKYAVRSIATNDEVHGLAGFGILHRIDQQVGEDMAQEARIRLRQGFDGRVGTEVQWSVVSDW